MLNTMNPKLSSHPIQRAFWTAALLLTAMAATASTSVTFQIDMSNKTLTTGQTVEVRGTFDGWATPGSTLTNNPGGANPNLYSGTYLDTDDANGTAMQWQYVIVSNNAIVSYSAQASGHNYGYVLPTNGGALMLPIQFWSDDGSPVTNSITFQVDMAEQLHLGNFVTSDNVYCQGSFEGWNDNFQLTNNPALNVTNGQGFVTSLPYQGTYTGWSASPGAAGEFKFVYNNGADHYETARYGDGGNNNNRFLLNQTAVLPLVSFSDQPFNNTVTNNVTFVVDMSVQETYYGFNPATETVQLFGDYDNWTPGTTMTNTNSANPALFYATIQYIDGADSYVYFKYQIDPGGNWENPAASNLIGGNRYVTLLATNGNLVAGPVLFSDQQPPPAADLISASNCMVTFTVDMTAAVNGTVDGSLGFTPGFDTVELNGLNGGTNDSFWTWSASAYPPQYSMTYIGNNLYQITLPVNKGQLLNLTYDYGIDGQANEQNGNHQHYIRSQPNYTMPTDVFASAAPAEQSFGNLTITNLGNQVSLSWLGRTGVYLQASTNLANPNGWTTLPLTDGTNLIVTQGPGNSPPVGYAVTNIPTAGPNTYYRLVGPQ